MPDSLASRLHSKLTNLELLLQPEYRETSPLKVTGGISADEPQRDDRRDPGYAAVFCHTKRGTTDDETERNAIACIQAITDVVLSTYPRARVVQNWHNGCIISMAFREPPGCKRQ